MSEILWPASLPNLLLEGNTLSYKPHKIVTQMEEGPGYEQLISSSVEAEESASILIEKELYDVWVRFFTVVLAGGTKYCFIPLVFGDEIRTRRVRISDVQENFLGVQYKIRFKIKYADINEDF